jgi:hypothetical protein
MGKEKVSAMDSQCPIVCAAFFILSWLSIPINLSCKCPDIQNEQTKNKKKREEEGEKKMKELCIVRIRDNERGVVWLLDMWFE